MRRHLPRSPLAPVVIALGHSAFVTQVVLMRELVSVLAGNELIFGVVLGAWLLLTGLGSRLGTCSGRLRGELGVFLAAQLAVAAWPIVAVFLLRTLRNELFLRGAALGVTQSVIVCVACLAPYCLLMGYLLVSASALMSAGREARGIGRVYFLDCVGGVLAGVVFSFVLVRWLDHFQTLYLAAAVSLVGAAWAAWRSGYRGVAVASTVTGVCGLAVLVAVDLDDYTARILYRPQTVVFQGHSPYGSLVVTRTGDQYNFLENGTVWFTTHNLEAVEESVHYAMAQRPDARRVLLLSGGVSGTARELLKYAAHIDYVELDPLVLTATRQFSPDSLNDPRIDVINTDGRLFLRETERRYDVILVDMPDPTTSQLNRFFTREFFAEAKRRLAPGGVLSFALGRYENRISDDLARSVAVVHNTLAEQFANVLVIPTTRLRFLASDQPLTTRIAERLEAHAVPVRLLDRHYLQAVLAPDRMDDVARALDADAPVNRDFNPILYYHHLRRWMQQFDVRFGPWEVVLLVVVVVALARLRPVSYTVFASGFAGSALEVVLLMGFQVLFGSVYHRVGLIVTMFLLGLALGSHVMNRALGRCGRRALVLLAGAVAVIAACVPPGLVAVDALVAVGAWIAVCQGLIYVATLCVAFLTGLVFPLAAKLDYRGAAVTASRLYTADYLGAALGALLVSTMLIPLVGVTAVCLLAAGLNLVAAAVLWRAVAA